MSLRLKVEFEGGLHLLFSNQRSHVIYIPAIATDSTVQSSSFEIAQSKGGSSTHRPADVTFLLHWLKDNLLKERPELFMEGDTV